MSTIELKNRIHSLVDTINDSEMLQAILTLLNRSDSTGDWWDDLSDEQKASVERGLEQANRGEFVPASEVKASVDKLLGRA